MNASSMAGLKIEYHLNGDNHMFEKENEPVQAVGGRGKQRTDTKPEQQATVPVKWFTIR